MPLTPPTTPDECYELSPFGFGPFPEPGQSVDVCPPHPVGGGFGGVGFLSQDGSAMAGDPYGLGSYGSAWFGKPDVNIDGGYGGDPYGFGPYGSADVTPPFISSAISLNGFEIELFFSEEVDPGNAALTDPASYTLEPVVGAAPATVTAVHIEKVGSVNLLAGDTVAGVTSVVITHTGTTQGGQYKVHAVNLTDIAGNSVIDSEAVFLAEGQPPQFTVTQPNPDPGDQLLVTFSAAMLRGVDEPGPGDGIDDAGSYVFTPVGLTYPIDLVATTVGHQTDSTKVLLGVKGQTSLEYTLKVGPSLAFTFDTTQGLVNATRVDTGTGTVTTSASGYLVVSRPKDVAFGMEWQDQSGSIVPLTSTLRADCDFDFSAALYDPTLTVFPTPEVADIVVQDGPPGNGVLVRFTLQKDAGNNDEIRIRSGAFDVTVTATWSDARHTLSLVRNMKAGIVAFLLDDHPLTATLTANVTGVPETQAGIRFSLLTGGWAISGVRLHSVTCTASQTIFSDAWNFLHEQTTTFNGSPVLARDSVLTRRGPLVKDWGDATPATKQDVTVTVNGTTVEVKDVNPYIGRVVLAVPIPLLPQGDPQAGVSVDYQWFKSPTMELAGLNTPGLVLNQWACSKGHHLPPAHGDQVQTPTQPKGAVDQSRFPLSVVLGPMERRKPVLIGHRYLGFERAYSALLNSPTTLVLNQAPGRASVPGFGREVGGVSAVYEGLLQPTAASPAWAKVGTDYGGVDHGLGTYTVIDAKTGSFDPTDLNAVIYHRGVDLSFPSSVNLVTRFQRVTGALFDTTHPGPDALDGAVTVPDGVFTGVGFGIHDNRYLYLCGVLVINGVEHVGLLLNPKRLHERDAWTIGPQAVMTATAQDKGTFAAEQTPRGFAAGGRFQVFSGGQAGVYTASSVVRQTDGTTTVTFTPDLPEPWDTFGNKYITTVFETRTSAKVFTYRLDIDTDQQVAELRVSGEIRGVVATIDGNVPALPQPASTSLLIPQGLVGQMFWGSLSRQAASRATWSFARYGVVPDQVFLAGHAVVVTTQMSDLPEDNPPSGGGTWFQTGGAGIARIEKNADSLLLKSVVGSEIADFALGYSRIEPFFIPDAIFDLQAKVRMDSGSFGAGDFELHLDDTRRRAMVRSLLYLEDGAGESFRRIISLPSVGLTGFLLPEVLGWTTQTGSTLTGSIEGSQMVTSQTATSRGGWEKHLDWTEAHAPAADEGRVTEARLRVTTVTPNAGGDTGILFGCQATGSAGQVVIQVEVTATEVRLRTATGAAIQAYVFDPTDGPHTYRVVADRIADAVTLLIDDEVKLPVAAFSAFSGGTNNTQVFFGCFGKDINNQLDNTIACEVEWHHVHCHALAPAAAKRTIGVLKGPNVAATDPLDINNYEVPRTDASTAPNASQTGPVIEEMDWRQDMEIRVLRDPRWGVTVLRPDLPPPPYYQAEDGTAGTGFATDTTEPSAGWINVEYQHLPRSTAQLGVVGFGCFEGQAISQTKWDWVQYRFFRHPTEDRIAPEHMVLNQYNVIASGELTQDTGLEKVVVQTLDLTRLTLLPTHLRAKSVYKVIDGATIWTAEHWTFDSTLQMLTLQPDPTTGEPRQFSAAGAAVTVMFIPGKPITSTYLKSQPVLAGVTQLNEGTPPVPKSQVATSTTEVVFSDVLNNVDDVLNDDDSLVLNNPLKAVVHKDVEGTLYDDLDFFEVPDDGEEGLIAAICEGGPGTGFSGLAGSEGEDIYAPGGGGAPLGGTGNVANHETTGAKVGLPVGAEVFAFSGTQFWQDASTPKQAAFPQKGGMPGGIFMLSGGNFGGPTVDANGNIVPGSFVPGGGTLGPGSAVLYPSFPARGKVGGDSGRIYKRTDWFLRLRAVFTDTQQPEVALDESLVNLASDSPAPSTPDYWQTNPDGVVHAQGAAFGVLSEAANVSRLGPWGGVSALTPDKDSGTFTIAALIEGSTVTLWDRVAVGYVTFTARAVPVASTDFLLAPNPHTALAAAINAVMPTLFIATAGLDLSGNLIVKVESVEPVTIADPVFIGTGDPAAVRLTKVIPYPGNTGLLIGGAKITQSSALGGGAQTLDANGISNSLLGMVLVGGQTLPTGAKVKLSFTPA